MRLRKNIFRTSAFVLVGAIVAGTIFVVNNLPQEDTTAAAGTWANYVSTAWMNENDSRYKDYKTTPGSTEDSPYLIKTAEEFSGIRAFENGSSLAGKYLKLANDIDLSAHHWDPIEIYGNGNPIDDIYEEYDGVFKLPAETDVVHIDGNSMKISGMTISNTYDEVTVRADWGWYEDSADELQAGSTGLFSFAYKAKIADIRLENPTIVLSETSMVPARGYYDWGTNVVDIVGSVVGVSQYSRVSDVHVGNLKIDYTAKFGESVEVDCGSSAGRMMSTEAPDRCETYFMPMHTIAGGAVGYSFGQTLLRDTSVKGGYVNVKPDVYEDDNFYMYDLNEGSISVAGLVGVNHQSAVLSTCSSADVVFSDADFALSQGQDETGLELETSRRIDMSMFFGGLVGFSSSEFSIMACIYNSCSHSDVNIDATLSYNVTVGGIVGGLLEDSMVNNFFDGKITANEENYIGEIVGAMSVSGETEITHTIASNYYMSGRYDPYGETDYEGNIDDMFGTISTLDNLVMKLNAGREQVLDSIMMHTNLSEEYVASFMTEWAIQDGTFPLSCTNSRTAGLEFKDNRIDVPNTGAK